MLEECDMGRSRLDQKKQQQRYGGPPFVHIEGRPPFEFAKPLCSGARKERQDVFIILTGRMVSRTEVATVGCCGQNGSLVRPSHSTYARRGGGVSKRNEAISRR